MMTKLSTIAAISAVLFCGSVFSAPIGNLKVAGDIKPPTCTVNGESQAEVLFELGNVSPMMLQSKYYSFDNQGEKDIVITCDAATYLTFKTTDTNSAATTTLSYPNVPYSHTSAYYFSLVPTIDPSERIGGVAFKAKSASVDGVATVISRANDGDYVVSSQTNPLLYDQYIMNRNTMTWTSTSTNNIAPTSLKLIAGKVFAMSIAPVDTHLYSKTNIDMSSGVEYQGLAVMNFKFGI
ncbi:MULTISPECIES: type 1 fimbrial protein [Providencia]|uniref:type 1 fimbrial protein n=2 Tax=Morganellaceae TaxID=1903414 RepID=UPI00141A3E0C|nr:MULTISPECIES: type 1 fimbrial protein [Providencia]NIA46516.1 type 1 fimbrial protein [Providencia rettgeri]NIA99982.1 type 1 fimbrial protein [Providencia rettgeri]NIB17802.1 type 1 fimbrial protein [Providencia rettgeri]NIB37823.1 type 1 fimbrial protein [Providencia rettgeri]NIL73887.1 type 1 fimbrial protein [Providencia sp. 504mA]